MTPSDTTGKTTPAARATRAEKRSERRQAMVETAARLFAELGYDGCEMERVAGDLKIAKGTLYLYFPGKQELFFACVDWGMSRMQLAVRSAAESEASRLRAARFRTTSATW